MKIYIPKLKLEHFFSMFLVLFWGKDILFGYARAVLIRIPYIKYIADYIIPVLMLLCLFFALPYFIKSVTVKDIFFTGIVFIVFLLNLLLYYENESLWETSGTFFLSVFPLYFIGLRFETSKHFRLLYITSTINVWAFAVYYLLIGSTSLEGSQGEFGSFMGRAYVLLPQLLVVINQSFKKKNFINILTGIIGFVFLLMCGNRGSVVLLLLFVAAYLLFNTHTKKRAYVYVTVFAFVGIVLYYFRLIAVTLTTLFAKMGMSTRIFDRVTSGSFFESGGRRVIYDILSEAIKENPLLGYGLCSDRVIAGSYSHNFAFELWTAFGVIFGTALIILTLYVIIGAWIKTKSIETKGFLLVLICVGFIKLFLSSSFLLEGLFFMLLGVCVTQFRKDKADSLESEGCQVENL